MIRLLGIGLWACLVATASSYATGYWSARKDQPAGAEETAHGLEHKKTRTINVPLIADGAVQGYAVAQFVYTIDAKVLQSLSVPPDAYILDEAFRAIYGEALDARKLTKLDIAHITTALVSRVNARVGGDAVKDILVQDFTVVGREELRR